MVNAGDGQVVVSWAAANLNGGTLLNYTATAFSGLNSGTTVRTCTTAALSCTITGLSNGTTYYISLQTENTAAMYSVRSDPRVPATPSKQPGAPTSVAAIAGDAQATVSWTAPTSTGAGALGNYTVWYSAAGGAYTSYGTATGTSTVVTGLSNGTSYTFEVTASNPNGAGPLSAASTAVVPLAAGAVPAFAAPVSTETGFTSSITNWDSGTTYSVTASNGASAVLSGSGVITVTGLSNGAGSHLVVTAARFGQTTTNGTLDGAALLTGIAPTFSGDAATTTGFSFTIANYAPSASYTVSTSSGTVSRSDATVTVTGLSLGDSATVTVGVSQAGSTAASATHHAAAMVAGTAPTFSGLVATADGFHVEIANYDSALDYAFVTTGAVHASRSGSTITVTGVAPGASTTVSVTATLAGVSAATASTLGTALLAGTAPAVSPITQTVDGFAFTITNPDAAVGYSVTSTAGTAVLDAGIVTVTGLTPGQSADVTVTVTKSGHVADTEGGLGLRPDSGGSRRCSVHRHAPQTASLLPSRISMRAAPICCRRQPERRTISGSTVTVSGLTAASSRHGDRGRPATAGHTDALATQSGTALARGAVPSATGPIGSTAGPAAPATTPALPSTGSSPVETRQNATTGRGDIAVLAPVRESKVGQFAVTSDGDGVPSTVSSSKTTVKIRAANGLSLSVAAQRHGTTLPLAADGAVEVHHSGQLWVTVAGFAPRSAVTIWAMSDPLKLTAARTDASGAKAESILLPHALEPGSHTLIVTGEGAQGQLVTMQLGIRVLDVQSASAVSPVDGTWLGVVASRTSALAAHRVVCDRAQTSPS